MEGDRPGRGLSRQGSGYPSLQPENPHFFVSYIEMLQQGFLC